jgi:hypothetical protein
MNKKETAAYLGGSLLIILLIKKMVAKRNDNVLINMDDGQSDGVDSQAQFQAPYLSLNAGIPDWKEILNGGNTFNSVTNIAVNPSLAMQLDRKYIPLFGFVGVTTYAVGEPSQQVVAQSQARSSGYTGRYARSDTQLGMPSTGMGKPQSSGVIRGAGSGSSFNF